MTMITSPVWYFAIGSMMNPISMKNRNIKPIQSKPGELLDFELKFFGAMGFAEAVPAPGKSFHGVVHLVDMETLERLDKFEITYVRSNGKVRMYDGTIVNATVYTKVDFEDAFVQVNNPPFERYIDILIEGAKYFGVNQKQIDFLKNHECRPRPIPDEFDSFGEADDDSPLLDYEKDVLPFNCEKSDILRIAFNGKVREICRSEVKNPLFERSLHFYRMYGQREELVFSQTLYDPKYGCPERLEDFTREHSAYIEHMAYSIAEIHNTLPHWKIVGRIEQKFRS